MTALAGKFDVEGPGTIASVYNIPKSLFDLNYDFVYMIEIAVNETTTDADAKDIKLTTTLEYIDLVEVLDGGPYANIDALEVAKVDAADAFKLNS